MRCSVGMGQLGTGMARGAYPFTFEAPRSNVSQTQERRQRVQNVTDGMACGVDW